MTTQDELLEHARQTIPRHYSKADRPQEELHASAEVMVAGHAQVEDWIRQTYILEAEGVWLDAHAEDRGLRRQEGEDDAALRVRLRQVEDAVTRPALMAQLQQLLVDAGVAGSVAMVELRRDRAYFGTFEERGTIGATFGTDATTGKLTVLPDVPFETPIEVGYARSGAQSNPRIFIQDWVAGGVTYNDLYLPVIDLIGNTLVADIAGAPTDHDAGAFVLLSKWDEETTDVRRDWDPPRPRAFLGRGYRMAADRAGLVAILPYGSTEQLRLAALDLLRSKAAGGVAKYVERRSTP